MLHYLVHIVYIKDYSEEQSNKYNHQLTKNEHSGSWELFGQLRFGYSWVRMLRLKLHQTRIQYDEWCSFLRSWRLCGWSQSGYEQSKQYVGKALRRQMLVLCIWEKFGGGSFSSGAEKWSVVKPVDWQSYDWVEVLPCASQCVYFKQFIVEYRSASRHTLFVRGHTQDCGSDPFNKVAHGVNVFPLASWFRHVIAMQPCRWSITIPRGSRDVATLSLAMRRVNMETAVRWLERNRCHRSPMLLYLYSSRFGKSLLRMSWSEASDLDASRDK